MLIVYMMKTLYGDLNQTTYNSLVSQGVLPNSWAKLQQAALSMLSLILQLPPKEKLHKDGRRNAVLSSVSRYKIVNHICLFHGIKCIYF